MVKVELSYDRGLSWVATELAAPVNTYAWQNFTGVVVLPGPGWWVIHARATDHTGAQQPMLVPSWNPGGYGNNQCMSVDVEVA